MNEQDSFSSDLRSIAMKCTSLYDTTATDEDSPIYSELMSQHERYEHREEIARGGMKRISKVYDYATSRHVALAELRSDIDSEQRKIFLREVFLREARLTALLKHPNIIQVHDIGLDSDGNPYFTMDLKTGDSLSAILHQLINETPTYIERYPLEQRLQLFQKICDAVSYAHAEYVIHLDIKPENIQVGEYGEVVLCDWGLGKILSGRESRVDLSATGTSGSAREHRLRRRSTSEDWDEEEDVVSKQVLNHMTAFSTVKGTPGYMPPEQFDPEGATDHRSDIYALGCVLYSLCALQAPFDGSVIEIESKVRQGQIKPIRKRIPRSLIAMIEKAMSVNPEDRYQSVRSFKADLDRYVTGHATLAEKANPLTQLSLFVKRHQRIATVLLFALIALSITTVIYLANLNNQNLALKRSSSELKQKSDDLEKKTNALKQKNKELEVAKRHALANQKRAEYVASQYRKEKKNIGIAARELEKRTMFTTTRLRESVYDAPITSIQEALTSAQKLLEIEPGNKKARVQIPYLQFTMQNFKEVNHLVDLGYPFKKNYSDIARKYAKFVHRRTLPKEMFAEVIHEIAKEPANTMLITRMLAVDHELRGRVDDHVSSLEAVLRAWHPEWDGKDISYDPQSLTLNINSPQVRILNSSGFNRWGACPLKHLKINHLNLSHSGIYDLMHIRLLDIQYLNISHTNIDNLNPIIKMPLRELVVHQNQFTAAQLNTMPPQVKIQILSEP